MGGTSTSCASVVATQYLLREWNRSLVRGRSARCWVLRERASARPRAGRWPVRRTVGVWRNRSLSRVGTTPGRTARSLRTAQWTRASF